MEMQQMRHFHAVAEHKSLLRAAKALNLTQPALSRSIRALETELEVRLFNRTSRGVTLTPFGVEFLQHVRLILNEQQRAILSIGALRNGHRGQLNVGVGYSFASSLLPQAAKKLLDTNPAVSMRVREGYFEELIQLLRVGEIDLVLSLMPEHAERLTDLVVTPLIEMRSEVIVNKDHPLARKKIVTVEDLARAKWILQDQAHINRSLIELFEARGLEAPHVVVKTTSVSFLRGMLRVSDFVGLLASQLVAADLTDGSLVVLKTDLPAQPRRGGAVHRAFGSAHPGVKSLIQKLVTLCRTA